MATNKKTQAITNYSPFDTSGVKISFATHTIPIHHMAGVLPVGHAPKIGDLAVVEVLTLGHHQRLELRNGVSVHIFPGDILLSAFGNRYATDQYEGYVPKEPVTECDLLSVGGVLGLVATRHPTMDVPTRLRVKGMVCDEQGRPLNLRLFGLEAVEPGSAQVVLVVGSSMNAGKTTTGGTLVRALKQGGFQVAAAKITGTAAGKDARYFASCGARPVLDFTFAGFPSTYMIRLPELLAIYRTLISHVAKDNPDFIVVEVADGIFQRETRMLLECEEFRRGISHVFFAANDSLSAECAVRWLREYDLPLRGISGTFSQSTLALREAEAATAVRCFNIEQMLAGGVLEVMGLAPGLHHNGVRTKEGLSRTDDVVPLVPRFYGNGETSRLVPLGAAVS